MTKLIIMLIINLFVSFMAWYLASELRLIKKAFKGAETDILSRKHQRRVLFALNLSSIYLMLFSIQKGIEGLVPLVDRIILS